MGGGAEADAAVAELDLLLEAPQGIVAEGRLRQNGSLRVKGFVEYLHCLLLHINQP